MYMQTYSGLVVMKLDCTMDQQLLSEFITDKGEDMTTLAGYNLEEVGVDIVPLTDFYFG